jgi:hypothetical protein
MLTIAAAIFRKIANISPYRQYRDSRRTIGSCLAGSASV